ncbi:PspA-associated protein PspAA [Actinocorallia aurantiaca]|jgi:hypothetical protein|uniref:PspA-associated domain-containing protein n=1 Tax=Actinocorallia aurantiaca TaxID=46204 RepID=A0ABN3UHA1_9ACTN
MIVRIMGEGQVELDQSELPALNELDAALESAIEADDEERFRRALNALLDSVRERGSELPADSLEPSDLVLPPADAHIDEVRAMLGDSGLIPE